MRWGSRRLPGNASYFRYRVLLIILRRDASVHGHGVLQLTEKQKLGEAFCFYFCFVLLFVQHFLIC